MRMLLHGLLLCYVIGNGATSSAQDYQPNLPNADAYRLVFQDEFEGTALDWTVWDSEEAVKRSPSGQKVYRSKTNAVVEDGLLKLIVRREPRKGSDWTAAFVWLRENYGVNTYYESRFINTRATGVNNAFWVACKTSQPKPYENRYEIDCPENKLHVDGTVHAHLAWHDWKTITYLNGKHIAQGFRKKLPDSGIQTWGLWVGEKDFAIYYDGQLQWDGKTHPRYTQQYCSGVGKFPKWNPQEERRAYGKYGQEDWCYFGGMNGDQLNVCLSTMPWHAKGTPLTDSAHNTFMGVDYVRIYKRANDFKTTPTQQADSIVPGRSFKLKSPIDLSMEENSYFSFLVNRQAACDVSLSLLTDAGALSTLRITAENAIEIDSGPSVASTADSYPAKDRLGSSIPVGSEFLVVVRITGQSAAKDIISCKFLDPDAHIPEREPLLYHNMDDRGNTSFTTEWDLSKKTPSSDSITAVAFAFDESLCSCSDFRAAPNYFAVVHRHLMSTAEGAHRGAVLKKEVRPRNP